MEANTEWESAKSQLWVGAAKFIERKVKFRGNVMSAALMCWVPINLVYGRTSPDIKSIETFFGGNFRRFITDVAQKGRTCLAFNRRFWQRVSNKKFGSNDDIQFIFFAGNISQPNDRSMCEIKLLSAVKKTASISIKSLLLPLKILRP